MKKGISEAIINTICYSEIFSYPLTFSELYKYLIYHKKISKDELLVELERMGNFLYKDQEYFTYNNTTNLVSLRKKRNKESKRKFKRALMIASFLSLIPTIKLIGISGSLSMQNSTKDDDIDLFFITSENALWLTRFAVVMLLICFRQKRQRVSALSKDKICPNMFLSESNLELPISLRNLYVAHEVSQMKVIYAKDYMDDRFYYANKWVLRYLPHAFVCRKHLRFRNSFFKKILLPFEIFAFKMQYLYMKKRITNEKIGRTYAMFHPRKNSEVVSDIYLLKTTHRKKMYLQKMKMLTKPLGSTYN